jgi:uncharacterized protein (DUF58 family)
MRLLPLRFIQQFYQSWLRRRLPPKSRQILHRKNIFILPSKVGLGFLATVALLWLLGTNYQNNLMLVLAFLLLSLLHTCILYTYVNFSGLSLTVKNIEPCFVGDTIKMVCLLKNTQSRRSHHRIAIGWDKLSLTTIDVTAQNTQEVTLSLPASQRGIHHLDRLMLTSVYPLGLIRVWAKLDMNSRAIVYPKPIKTDFPEASLIESDKADEYVSEQAVVSDNVSDDVSHLREYQEGDAPKHIAWKAYAKGQGLATKIYENTTSVEPQHWLKWDDFLSVGIEERLSRLCYCALQAEIQGRIYGLELPSQSISLGHGLAHQQAVLYALAMFGKKKNTVDVTEGGSYE